MHIGNREEAKMKRCSHQKYSPTALAGKRKKRKIPIICGFSGFASVPTSVSSVFLWRADDLTEGKLHMVWDVWLGRDQVVETISSEGFYFWIPIRRTGVPTMAWELPGWTVHTFVKGDFPPLWWLLSQHVWKTDFSSFVFSAPMSQYLKLS